MKIVLSVDNMRKSEQAAFGAEDTNDIALMMRASRGIVKHIPSGKSIAVIVAGGNNGGDGYCCAMLLSQRGENCTVIRASEKTTPAGQYYLDKCICAGIKMINYTADCALDEYDVILDSIFGTGFRGEIGGKYAEIIGKINSSGAYVVSADINSGLNGDSGIGPSAVKSDVTVAVGYLKPGHILSDAKDLTARLVVEDIGIPYAQKPYYLLEGEDFTRIFPKRAANSNKGTYGYCALIGGSDRYPGAAKLALLGETALRCGCGVARLAVPRGISPQVAEFALETTVFPMAEREGIMAFDEGKLTELTRNIKSAGVGFGWGEGGDLPLILKWLIEKTDVPLVIDADGLNCLAKTGCDILRHRENIILTPHPGEFARLIGKSVSEILSRPIDYAFDFAEQYKVTLLLKGCATVITDSKEVYLTNTGCSGMAKGGSGDILTGIITSLCAQRAKDTELALIAAAASYMAGKAGEYASEDFGEEGMLPSDSVKYIPRVISEIKRGALR
ncbi:MAG: NAD(P)H-hydrate dehydratase [Eubacteriaceae bacterium]|nr:NAD(P)H-hydrate dehydratase [Eubacteriaceae bacterium]